MTRRAALVLVLLTLAAAANAEPPAGAEAFVAGLYEVYAAPDAPSSLGSRAASVFSPGLLAAIRADQTQEPGESGKLDHDPICACQDPEGLKLSDVTIKAMAEGRSEATAAFRIGDARRLVHLALVSTDAGWKVDDVSEPGMKSLRAFLRPQAQ